MHTIQKLRRLIETISVDHFDGEMYRCVNADTLYRFTQSGSYTPRPLYNLGPPRRGARYTPKNGAPSIYFAYDIETACREFLKIAKPSELVLPTLQKTSAFALYSAKVSLEAVLDLTSLSIRRKLGTNRTELSSPWRYRRDRRVPPTHRIGAVAAASKRIQAIKFESTKGPGACFVVFTENLVEPAYVEVNDPSGRLMERIPT